MTPAPPPPNEAERLAELRDYGVLDTWPEADFDGIAELAARVCSVPVALITFVDESRVWFKSRIGLDAHQITREQGFCPHALGGPELLVVPDAAKDERFADNPLVTGESPIRFYAGAPLVTPAGRILGTLCVVDRVSRELTSDQRRSLELLSRQVMSQLQLRRLAVEEARFRAYAEQSNDAFFMHDLSGRFVEVNPQACSSLGYTREELLRMSLGDIAPEFSQLRAKTFWRDIAPGQFVCVESRHRRKDGSTYPVDVVVRRFDLKGEPHYLAVARNLTERESADMATRRSEAKFRAVVENNGEGILFVDQKARITYRSPSYTPINGYSDEERLGHSGFDTVHPDDLGALRKVWAELLAQPGRTMRAEYRIRHKDGAWIWVESAIQNLIENPYVGQIVVVTRDITQRRLAEAALRESESRYRQLIEASPMAIAVARGGRFLYVNPAFAAMHRLGAADALVGQPIVDSIAPEDRAAFARRAEGRESGLPADTLYEAVALRPDGTRFPFIAAVTMVSLADGPATVGFFQDVTALKQAETEREALRARLVQAQKMEAVGLLAGGVAHDFNNVLTGIMLNLELLGMGPLTPEEAQSHLAEIKECVDRAKVLTRQLLMFSRRQVVQMTLVDLNEIFGHLLKMLRRLLGENISLTLKAAPGPAWVVGDTSMLEQVVMNLAVNARDAMPDGGSIALELEALEFDGATRPDPIEGRAGRFIRLTVADTGCGMDEATRQKIFEPFFTTKERGRGTGLGLSIVYGIVKQHGGWIDVESAVGKGTTFRLHLPAAAAGPGGGAGPGNSGVLTGGRETILLAEDDPTVRNIVTAALRSYGYTVLAAQTGAEAWALYLDHDGGVDLLLTDMIMPEGMDGLQLARQCRGRDEGLEVIVMSGYSPELAHNDSLARERMSYLAKPFENHTLIPLVRQLLDQRQARLGQG